MKYVQFFKTYFSSRICCVKITLLNSRFMYVSSPMTKVKCDSQTYSPWGPFLEWHSFQAPPEVVINLMILFLEAHF